jgi:hypothetical protein
MQRFLINLGPGHVYIRGGEGKYISIVLDIDTRYRRVASLNPRPLYPPREVPTVIHWAEDWVGPRAYLNGVEKR